MSNRHPDGKQAHTLLIVRHAKSSWKQEGLADQDRPLSGRGKRDAERMGRELRLRGLVPGVIISSTARRARSTVKRMLREMDAPGEILEDREIYAGDVSSCLQAILAIPRDVDMVMIVGHNPTMEELVHLLTGQDVTMPTMAVACVDLALANWQALREGATGRLRLHIIPRDLDR
jgi:phosphohistidine phosphatase